MAGALVTPWLPAMLGTVTSALGVFAERSRVAALRQIGVDAELRTARIGVAELRDRVVTAFSRHCSGVAQEDDVTLLIVEILAKADLLAV